MAMTEVETAHGRADWDLNSLIKRTSAERKEAEDLAEQLRQREKGLCILSEASRMAGVGIRYDVCTNSVQVSIPLFGEGPKNISRMNPAPPAQGVPGAEPKGKGGDPAEPESMHGSA